MDKMREDFERWAIIEGLRSESHLSDDYFIAKKAWQASRAALVVELPKDYFKGLTPENEYEQGFENGYNLALNSFKRALDKAGGKYE